MSETADKVVELAKEIFNIGYEAGVKATNVDCGVVWEERIDAIKAEIKNEVYDIQEIDGEHDSRLVVDWEDVLTIFDKHCGGDTE